ncbi:asparagine synthase B [Novilysobacter defluvii]|uniref:asparagine synthase (glutamine-hydrolyzing) n=1 Tax=Lysobacter defluvii IMMIB APB-9 = DSM 18482 TaxID=1385515 RepID=A0A0A0MBJ5_9GAMM|nr:asparagine synthase B [Lysobacter defluvii]KGO98841.1 asparagine synthetase B [Lysobacter defluvii IMMIB APB-9 = DSM 18482]
MCSILGIFGLQPGDDLADLRRQALELSRRQRHRGPDWSGVHADEGAILVHERLAIVDPAGGAQPLVSADGNLVLAVNGEIYNHRELRATAPDGWEFRTASDCEVINALHARGGDPGDWLRRLNGIFAFALWDRAARRWLVARDPVGVVPLYWGRDGSGRMCVASEMKALVGICHDVAQFPPGHYYDSDGDRLVRYWERPWREHGATASVQVTPGELREAFEAAVHRQLMSDVPYGVLLSGGLDSSLVAACAARFARRRIEEDDRAEAWWPRLHSFAIGLEGSPDLAAAQVAADALGTVHHGFTYTLQEGLDALPEVIRHIESYDVTTVRASIPMYLLARRIRAMGVKMVLSGEGSDEIFGGYLYFHKAPDARQFHDELVRKLDALHQYDCLRANKSMMAWGVEARVPFLDLEFLEVAMRMDASAKMVRPRPPLPGDRGRVEGCSRPIEKAILREAFDGYLPDSILWRQKEQFSDGVGYGWIDGLKAHAESQVGGREFAFAASRFPVNPPMTKEAYLYRHIFERHFPGESCARTVPGGKSIACSSPAAIAWDAAFEAAADPSGRAVAGVHVAS